jgi:hypothetical protein
MVREVLADEAFLTGEEHLNVAELGVKVGINTRRGGLRPTQSGGSLKELTRHASQDHLGLRSVPGRLGLRGYNDLGITPGSSADTRHIIVGEVWQRQTRNE